uniref:Uncharacterized protein n=1 Tax=Spongospora subterranea TaxID=70186 RepID=A0A0H5QP21_9EUKA|eukprot:CRZ03136.1 hypothetical protein [Spongospora subterranea]
MKTTWQTLAVAILVLAVSSQDCPESLKHHQQHHHQVIHRVVQQDCVDPVISHPVPVIVQKSYMASPPVQTQRTASVPPMQQSQPAVGLYPQNSTATAGASVSRRDRRMNNGFNKNRELSGLIMAVVFVVLVSFIFQ